MNVFNFYNKARLVNTSFFSPEEKQSEEDTFDLESAARSWELPVTSHPFRHL